MLILASMDYLRNVFVGNVFRHRLTGRSELFLLSELRIFSEYFKLDEARA